MADQTKPADPFAGFLDMQGETMREVWDQFMPAGAPVMKDWGEISAWGETAQKLQAMWLEFLGEKSRDATGGAMALDPAQFMLLSQGWAQTWQSAATQGIAAQQKFFEEGMKLWQGVLGGAFAEGDAKPELPRKDRRFSDPAWRSHPAFALLHQTYLMVSEYMLDAAERVEGVDPEKKEQLAFATRALVEAMSPDNFLATNPVVLQRTIETRGANLVKGLQHLINDLKRGQLTHTDADAFRLGENIATTPGKVVHEGPLYQLIQYSPSTETVAEIPLVIFPPWINRFYILDLTPKKSFIKWAVDQGLTVFVTSWKSADASMKDVVWDDYIRAEIEAIDVIRARLGVKSVNTIGYCVAGTTLAAALAILARRGEADKVASATFFTAQVDFEKAGELKNFIDEGQLEMIGNLSQEGYLDGRYMAATFNLLRGRDLIWNYVVNNYLLGDDYPAFDLLHWNGDVTNLPAKWHGDYLRDLYRGNKLVVPDALAADGTPIDLTRIETPIYIQAGKEDHIAPAESVWRMTRHVRGPTTFVLAGSGHIAGVVNHPDAGKYQYWTGDSSAPSLEKFIAGATEHPGSWWPHWRAWLAERGGKQVPANGKRKPGGKGDPVIEDAPGRYVKTR
ncbi:class I poly(R)-hydroxyalkanoic acid synthase [Tsuneonella sp. YG55]|uniref:Class I poly(R)-hydroxyalkanoic acid synthase n=1 Tax=Tsuneonella litorea TaxID=2976475 RepID=A0A9X2W3V5_9SPHN|nr:class I poly(R)-hydroxyalkanoic acid synthase [Tsuneonella litorea]MCT2559196.1 class I poly(R)-hydroxyalkanoic acid synthase [Tsuneonella litorea]